MTARPPISPIRSIRAFSLVEVVLALGVVSFALVGILGLLFSGLTTFHRSIDQTMQSQIAQQIISQAQLTAYTNLASFSTNYDENGNPVSSTDPTAIYTVTFTLPNLSTSLTTNMSSSFGTNVVVQVWNKTSPNNTNVYSSVLVKVN